MIYCESNNSNGRLGNIAMRLMSLMGLSKRYNVPWAVPPTSYAQYFENDIPQKNLSSFDKKIKEPHYHYTPEFWDTVDFSQNVDIWGYLQTPKYWESKLIFKEDYKNLIKSKYSIEGNEIAISIRRGDFLNNSSYFQLSITYYITALLKHFPDWQQRNICIFSDDITYCMHHFECLSNVKYMEGSDIEQLCAMTLLKDFIISNSTFSYVGAYLSDYNKVIRPVKNLAGALAAKNSEKDYWITDWLIHDNEKINLTDTTFTIPVYFDHVDRRQNLDLCVCMLQRDFETNIIVGEHQKKAFEYMQQYCKYMHFEGDAFHRTKMLNDMCIEATTPIIYNWDADVFIAPMQILMAVIAIRQGADFVYPYDGRFARVPRYIWFSKLEKQLDTALFYDQGFKGKGGKDVVSSTGGAVCVSKDSFIDSGMENENMISYAPEDSERWDRWHLLEYNVQRVKGVLYHIDHFIGPNSNVMHPYYKASKEELDRERAMTKDEMRAYVETWPWVNKYSESYYSRIAPGAIESAKAVLDVLPVKFATVIDIGCGLGEWSKGTDADYTGVDYRVMRRALLIPEEKYIDYDLCSLAEFPLSQRFDLCLCLEVLEHLPTENAVSCVALLCSLSDVVLFSAAIPGQGGNGHINEQLPSYWVALFAAHGMHLYKSDIRLPVFHNNAVEPWYQSNMMLFTRKKYPVNYEVDFVHPRLFGNLVKHKK